METTTRSTARLLRLPVPPPQARQLSIAFETTALQGFGVEQRASATQALALVLLQAADVSLAEDDDGEL